MYNRIAGYFSGKYFWPILVNFENSPKFKTPNLST